MKSRRRFNFRKIAGMAYIVAFLTYCIIGLQPAGAHEYEISGSLNIPSINLVSDVTTLKLEDHKLATPETIVGSYSRYDSKIFLIGHSTTVFKNLDQIRTGDTIYYNSKEYTVIGTKTLKKENIDMDEILGRESSNTLIIMTCAGKILDGGDATHRFIVTATEN